MTPRQKVTLLLFYHLISIALVYYLYTGGDFASGPCNPGIGLLFFLLLGLILGVLLFISVAKFFVGSKPNKYLFFINLLAFTIWITAFYKL